MKIKSAITIFSILFLHASCWAGSDKPGTNDLVKSIQDLLDSYQSTTNYSLLEKSGDSLNMINQAEDEASIKLRLALIRDCEAAIKSGETLMSGRIIIREVIPPPPFFAPVDPSEIQDPVVRKKYEDDIAENDRVKAIGKRITTLQHIVENQIAHLNVILRQQPSESALRKRVIELVNTNIVDAVLKKKILD
jgi:hypothetical protein